MDESFESTLRPTPIIDSSHPEVAAYAAERASGATSEIETAVQLYYAVRDDIRYDPYSAVVTVDGLKASRALALRRAWCVPKAALLTACCRALGIPARVGFADVRNHLSTTRMREHMQTEIFHWHGYSSIYLDGLWLKATPAFNLTLCQKAKLLPLEFDGRSDSIFQPFDAQGNRHMEYVRMHGEFDDVPLERILEHFRRHYSHMMRTDQEGPALVGPDGDFEQEVDAETSGRS